MWNQLSDMEQHATALPELAGLTGAELLDLLFGGPRYIWVRRRDKVRLAISLWRALQTRIWRRERPIDDDGTPQLQYSFDAIEHLRRSLSIDDEAWGRFFASSGIEPLVLSYEEDVEPLPADPVSRVLAHLDVELPPLWARDASTVRQSDGLNDAGQAA
jgi:trehalose 2-sulfotransferase